MDEGFRAMYEAEFAGVCRSVALMCGDPSVAEDATQEAFARALARWRRLRNAPWAPGWVTTTAMNVARRSLRRRSLPEPTTRRETDADTELDLRAAVAALPSRQQEAVALHYLLDMSVAETAAAMGCGEGTVKTHLSRARAALAHALEDEGEDEDEVDDIELDTGEPDPRRRPRNG